MSLLAAMFTGPGLRITIACVALVGALVSGFRMGLAWDQDEVDNAREEAAAANAKAKVEGERATKAQEDYRQLSAGFEEVSNAAQASLIAQRKANEDQIKKERKDYQRRMDAVLDHTRRMLAANNAPGSEVRPDAVSEAGGPSRLDDPAVRAVVIGRAGECAKAEERLRALQAIVRDHVDVEN